MKLLAEEPKKEIEYLLSLSRTDIGNLATTDFFIAQSEETVMSVKRRLKKETNADEPIVAIYIVNQKKDLVGVISLHELLLQDNDTRLYKCMVPNVVAVYLTTPLEIALKKLVKYKLYSMPIINDKRHVLGVIDIDDVVEYMQEHRRSDGI